MTDMFNKTFLAKFKKEPKPKFKLGDKAYFKSLLGIIESEVVGINMHYTKKGNVTFSYALAWNDGLPRATALKETFLTKTKRGASGTIVRKQIKEKRNDYYCD